jgi:hypothetical protein
MAIACLAGVIRGITGFGGAMVLTPPLALLLGPQLAVPVVLLVEAFAGAPMLRDAARLATWRTLTPIGLAACVTIPLGGYVLVHADQDALRRAIAAVVAIFALLLLRGARYTGAHGVPSSLAVGALSGTLLGATGIGGPPVIRTRCRAPTCAGHARQPYALRGVDFGRRARDAGDARNPRCDGADVDASPRSVDLIGVLAGARFSRDFPTGASASSRWCSRRGVHFHTVREEPRRRRPVDSHAGNAGGGGYSRFRATIMPVFDAALDGGIEDPCAARAAAVHMADASRIAGDLGVARTGGPVNERRIRAVRCR